MSQNTTIQAAETKNTNDYYAYKSADDGETICIMSISVGAAEQLDSEFIEVELSDEEGTEVMLDSSTSGYGKYRSAGGAVGPSQPLYVSRETLAEFSDDNDEGVPESIFVTLRPSDEDTFEEAREAYEQEQAEEQEDEVESLVAGTDDSDEEDEEEVEIADEEVGLVE